MEEGTRRVRFAWWKIPAVVIAVILAWWLVNLFIGGSAG